MSKRDKLKIAFLIDEMAQASLFVHTLDKAAYEKNTQPMLSHINVGTGVDVTIKKLAQTVQSVVGFEGSIVFDQTKPNGTPRKLMNVHLLNALGWGVKIDLRTCLVTAYQDFLENHY